MDRIRKISVRGAKARIELDSGAVYELKKKDLAEWPLQENDDVDEKEFLQFVRLHQYPDALNKAVAMLARRACSRKEIAEKLTGYCDDIASLVLYKLEKENLLDDRDFSLQWARYRSGCGHGPQRIYRELRAKGIDEETAREAVASLDESDQFQKAVELAEKSIKRAKPGEDPRKTRERMLRALIARGFDWDTAREAVNQVMAKEV